MTKCIFPEWNWLVSQVPDCKLLCYIVWSENLKIQIYSQNMFYMDAITLKTHTDATLPFVVNSRSSDVTPEIAFRMCPFR